MGQKKIIYIAGYGRSGSTILDIMLSNSPDVSSGGALSNILEWLSNDNLCACGQHINNCEYWSNYKFTQIDNNYIKVLLKRQKKSERFYLPFFKFKNEYSNYLSYTYNYVLEGNKALVDSSKTSYDVLFRPYLANKYTEFDVKIIFLRRKFSDVLKSSLKRHGSPERNKGRSSVLTLLVTLISYTYTYLFTYIIFKTFREDSRMVVQFEDLKRKPKQILNEIGEKFKLNLNRPISILNKNKSFDINHKIGGNRIRFTDDIKFQRK